MLSSRLGLRPGGSVARRAGRAQPPRHKRAAVGGEAGTAPPRQEQQQPQPQPADLGSSSSSVGPTDEEAARFHKAYAQVYTMSQLYLGAGSRPEPIPLSQWEARRRKRDFEDIAVAAKRKGKDAAQVQKNLEQIESLVPNLVDLNKMKPADWVALAESPEAAANKLILLKTLYPGADVFTIMAARPKMLLQSEAAIQEGAQQVKALLAKAENPDAIIQAVPELSCPSALSRSLGFLATSFPGQDPVALLQENPQILLNLGESNMEDFAEYGELSTKD